MKCPLCNKRLDNAVQVLGMTPLEVVKYHGDVHYREAVTLALMAAWDVTRVQGDTNGMRETFTTILRERLETVELTGKLIHQWKESVK